MLLLSCKCVMNCYCNSSLQYSEWLCEWTSSWAPATGLAATFSRFFVDLKYSSNSHRVLLLSVTRVWTSEFVHMTKNAFIVFPNRPVNVAGFFIVSHSHPSKENLWASRSLARCYVTASCSLQLACPMIEGGTEMVPLQACSAPTSRTVPRRGKQRRAGVNAP